MKTRTKKILSVLIAMIMIVSTFGVLAINTAALETLTIDNTVQYYVADGSAKAFAVIPSDDTIDTVTYPFTVTYSQSGTDVPAPTEVGSYDVTVTRDEDGVYTAVSEVITSGLVIRALTAEDVLAEVDALETVVGTAQTDIAQLTSDIASADRKSVV